MDAMLAEMTPQQLVEWKAARETIPLDDGWKQTDTIAGAFHDEMAQYIAGKAGKSRVPQDWLHKPGSYIPRVRRVKQAAVAVNQTSIDVTQSIIASHFAG